MTTFTLHTPAPLDLLHTLVAGRATVTEGRTLRGEPDCFAGWFERVEGPECVPNNLVESEDRDLICEIADMLVSTGHQVITTAPDAIGDDKVDLNLPTFYEMAHSH